MQTKIIIFDSFRKEKEELMMNLHVALTKHDNAFEQVCNRLSTLLDSNCDKYSYDAYKCVEGEVLEIQKSAEVTPDIHNTGIEKVSRFSELSSKFKSQETCCLNSLLANIPVSCRCGKTP